MAGDYPSQGYPHGHSITQEQRTVHDYLPLIEAISIQEYNRIRDPQVPFCTIVRLAALTVRVALLSKLEVNSNFLASLMRKTLREELAFHY